MIFIVHYRSTGHNRVTFLDIDLGSESRKVVGRYGKDLCVGLMDSQICHSTGDLKVKTFFEFYFHTDGPLVSDFV